MRIFIALLLPLMFLIGCVDATANLKADMDNRFNAQAAVMATMRAELKSEIRAELTATMDNKVQGVGGKIEEVKKDIKTQVDTRLDQAAQTFDQKIGTIKGGQNTGMFSGSNASVAIVAGVGMLAVVLCVGVTLYMLRGNAKMKDAVRSMLDSIKTSR